MDTLWISTFFQMLLPERSSWDRSSFKYTSFCERRSKLQYRDRTFALSLASCVLAGWARLELRLVTDPLRGKLTPVYFLWACHGLTQGTKVRVKELPECLHYECCELVWAYPPPHHLFRSPPLHLKKSNAKRWLHQGALVCKRLEVNHRTSGKNRFSRHYRQSVRAQCLLICV